MIFWLFWLPGILSLVLFSCRADQSFLPKEKEAPEFNATVSLMLTELLIIDSQDQNEIIYKRLVEKSIPEHELLIWKEFNAKSKKCIISVERLKHELIEYNGGIYEDGSYLNALKTERTYDFFCGKQKKGPALKKLLNDYAQLVRESGLPDQNDLALDGKSDPIFRVDKINNVKLFSEIHFGRANAVEALQRLSYFELQVALLERKVMEHHLFENAITNSANLIHGAQLNDKYDHL